MKLQQQHFAVTDLVVDASVVVAALVDIGPDGQWAERLLESDHLAAPHPMPAEVTNILRRASQAGISPQAPRRWPTQIFSL